MSDDLLPIGEISRRSGLTVSALRFYDRQGLLPATSVDPFTGYRRYHPTQVRQAGLLAGMRRIQLPLAEMAAVLDAGLDAETVDDLLQSHLRRLETGLRQARSEIGRLTALAVDGCARVRVDGARLLQALTRVRYAVAQDPELPALGAVLLEGDEDGLHVVATDRYRLAMAKVAVAGKTVTAESAGPGGGGPGVLLEAPALDAVVAHLAQDAGVVEIGLAHAGLEVRGASSDLAVAGMDAAFPDYRVVIEQAVGQDTLSQGVEEIEDVVARTTGEGVRDAEADGVVELPGGHLVSRPFLLEALEGVGPGGQLRLPSGVGPLVLSADDGERLALLMPLAPREAP